MVPGCVDEVELGALGCFIADLNPDIPYSLPTSHSDHHLRDLPSAFRGHAERCRWAALDAGVTRVQVANRRLLT